VAADGGDIVAFEIEEAPGDVEAVRWIQEQAEAGQQVFDFLPSEEIELLDGEMVDPLLGESAGDSFRALVGAGEDADPTEGIGAGDALNAGGDPIRLSSGVFRMMGLRGQAVRE